MSGEYYSKIDQDWVYLLKMMILARESAKREAILVRQGLGKVHVSSRGHEALMALPWQLKKQDYIFPYYRSHHLMMAKGMTRQQIALDFFMKSGSSTDGRNSPVHVHSRELNIFPSASPTASQCLPAVGAAWGQKISECGNNITLCSVGDGAIRQGEFYESVCFAIEKKLPIIFLIEDNKYAISTSTLKMNPFRLNVFNRELIEIVNGMSVSCVFNAAMDAIHKTRTNQGPVILWCEVERLDSHTVGEDHKTYRNKNEIDNLNDPVDLFALELVKELIINSQELSQLVEESIEEVKNIYATALAVKDLEIHRNDIKKYLFLKNSAGPSWLSSEIDNKSLTMVEALNKSLDLALYSDPQVLLFGEDIEDPKGGVFGFTKGLSKKYPGRVINSPLAEATIIGTAVGLSVNGYKPIFEIQFIDYIIPGYNQLLSNVGSLSWRSKGEWKVPAIFYAPYGAYLPSGGPWHSQSNDVLWVRVHGLQVGIPSTPQDMLELFQSALAYNGPSLLLIPKKVFRTRCLVHSGIVTPFGALKKLKTGKNLTIVSWGNGIRIVLEASDILEQEDIMTEVLDLRSLVPCDISGIIDSVMHTKRLIIVHEDAETCGFGQNIIGNLLKDSRLTKALCYPVQIIAGSDCYISFNDKLEYMQLPDVMSVVNIARKIFGSGR